MRLSWWKLLSIILLLFSVIMGFLGKVPALNILNETIRNLYFHVPMWFAMLIMFSISAVYAVQYLRSNDIKYDIKSSSYASTGIFFSIMGMLTGIEWAQYTWGSGWSNDPKQLGTALCMLTYFAYLVLRSGIKDHDQRAKISAVYNIFIYALMFPLIFILPRMVSSLHPGNGGNPAFNSYDLDHNMRLVFYPSVLGWILLGVWLTTLLIRIELIKHQKAESI